MIVQYVINESNSNIITFSID